MAKKKPLLYSADGTPIPDPEFANVFDPGPGTPWASPYKKAEPLDWAIPLLFNRFITPRSEEALPQYSRLRLFAALCDIVRVCIEMAKDELCAQTLLFRGKGKTREEKTRREVQDQADVARAFFEYPDRINGLDGRAWRHQLLEELFVTDGVYLFVHRDRAGDLHSLRLIAPETIRPVLNSWGARAGYQQVIRGRVVASYEIDEFIAPRHSPVSNSAYGRSHVETILSTVETAIRKSAFDLARFTSTTVPRGFVTTPDTWTPDQVATYQKWMDARGVPGDVAEQHKFFVLPGATGYIPVAPWQFDREIFEALVSIACARFGRNRSIFVTQTNRSNAEAVGAELDDPGLGEVKKYFLAIVRQVLALLGLDQIEPEWEVGSGDRVKAAEERKIYVETGIKRIDEVRDEMDLEIDEIAIRARGLTSAELTPQILSAGIVTVDEARAALNLEPLGAERGGDEVLRREADPLAPETAGDAGGDEGEEGGADEGRGSGETEDGGDGGAGDGERVRRVRARAREAPGAAPLRSSKRPVPDGRSAALQGRYQGRPHRRGAGGGARASASAGVPELPTVSRARGRRALGKGILQLIPPAPAAERRIRSTKAAKKLTARLSRKARKAIAGAAETYFAAIEPEVLALAAKEYEARAEKTAARSGRSRFRKDAAPAFDADASAAFVVDVGAGIRSVWRAAAEDAAGMIEGGEGLDFAWFEERAAAYADERAGELIVRVDETTVANVRDAVARGVRDGETLDEISERILGGDILSEERAMLIARTELAFAQNYGGLEAWDELGVEKVHVFDGDEDDDACIEANGQVWEIEYALDPENVLEHPNCRRAFSPAASGEE